MAVSFAFISVAVGIFGTYADLLRNAGPVGIWTWIVAAVGRLLIALVLAQFAARTPLSGSSAAFSTTNPVMPPFLTLTGPAVPPEDPSSVAGGQESARVHSSVS